jgi:hypothetical protein
MTSALPFAFAGRSTARATGEQTLMGIASQQKALAPLVVTA